ncbi:nucleoside transporter [Chitinophaga ginsengisegetis]|uniref:Nucleoside transporter n=1 Tax=Chitinophaga ginsengisegetis TaxID=393003 RepID=A0A1T5PCC6_9BACT|nr:nucleoside permease [Chitinophaga ginsengisegetis]SKD10038.1 nucleoside transporter [Chitinophaga ginsengisegetis]
MPLSVRYRLSVMMLLEYFVWGAWYVTMGTYLLVTLKTGAVQVGAAYANLSIAAIISPLFIGLVADRFFSAQRLLGTLHLLGAAVLFCISYVHEFNVFWWLILLYTLLYMPTISLTNAVAFRQMANAGREFPAIRVWGTVGWIIAGLLVGGLHIENSMLTFRIAAASAFLLGIYSFWLPDTPPVKQQADLRGILGVDALKLFNNRSYTVFFITAVAICIPLAFYYSFANPFLNDMGVRNAAGKMTMGQLSELLFMLLIPLMFARLGVKKMLLLSMLCWVLRYLAFAWGNNNHEAWMLYAGILLHGICYDFFFVTGQIYTDKQAGLAVKNSAQGLITFATYGVGMLIGSFVSGFTTGAYSTNINGALLYQWRNIWLVPAGITAVCILFFTFLFRDNQHK